jgi:uncharacterized protein (DUF3084 family)
VETIAEGGAEVGALRRRLSGCSRHSGLPSACAEGLHPDLQALEQELHTVKAQLRATIDELETSNEEMKSANEEYQSRQ